MAKPKDQSQSFVNDEDWEVPTLDQVKPLLKKVKREKELEELEERVRVSLGEDFLEEVQKNHPDRTKESLLEDLEGWI
jgi:hypothetical protein